MWLLVALGIVLQQLPLDITYEPGATGPVVHVGPVLYGDELEDGARSGLPIRVRVRVELWQDRFFDQLVDSTSWSTIILFEPLGGRFQIRSSGDPATILAYDTFRGVRAALETAYRPRLSPARDGRFYYTASLQIETLSVSDLEELERWLQGELQPAVSGRGSVPGAIGQGAKRLMLRILDLPTRRFDARTGRFRVPAASGPSTGEAVSLPHGRRSGGR
ncbi:MAG: hypothetical protein WD054_06440 [Gemmatimonadota bacterium]